MQEKFTITPCSNGFIVSGSFWRGTHCFNTRDEAIKKLVEWMDEWASREAERIIGVEREAK